MKIYLVAYGCEPDQGGEHEVGWKIANTLNSKCNLTVITRVSNKKLIEKENINNINFIYIENELGMKFKPKSKFSYLYYMFWQISTYNYLKKKVDKNDIIHYITFGNIHLPHFLYLLKCKLIIGPMGGGSYTQTNYLKNPSIKEKIKSLIHLSINKTVKINPFYNLMFKKANKIILRTEETLELIPEKFKEKTFIQLETGVETKNLKFEKKDRTLENILFVSRFVEHKNIEQAILVFKELQNKTNQPLVFNLLGDGPLFKVLKNKYSYNKSIIFHGKVSHDEVIEFNMKSDLLLFCSLKEGGSHAIFESAMNNIPIACFNISGMTVFPKFDSSIKIELSNNYSENTNNLAIKIIKYYENDKINEICENAINDLIENYEWDSISNKFYKLYQEVNNA